MLLVDGVSTLHKSSISQEDLLSANQKLHEFCKGFQRLYGIRHMSSNIHSLVHLAQSVADTGNLCLTHCFNLEDLNGTLAALVHGTLHAPKQIYQNLLVMSELPLLIFEADSEAVKEFYWKVTKRSKYLYFNEKIGDQAFVVGELDVSPRYCDMLDELISVLFPVPVQFRTFARLYRHKFLYVGESYEFGTRKSSFCAYKSLSGVRHGKILTFVRTMSHPVQYFALISKSDDLATGMDRYFLYNSIGDLDLAPISSLKCVSFCLEVNESLCLVDPLNSFELE